MNYPYWAVIMRSQFLQDFLKSLQVFAEKGFKNVSVFYGVNREKKFASNSKNSEIAFRDRLRSERQEKKSQTRDYSFRFTTKDINQP